MQWTPWGYFTGSIGSQHEDRDGRLEPKCRVAGRRRSRRIEKCLTGHHFDSATFALLFGSMSISPLVALPGAGSLPAFPFEAGTWGLNCPAPLFSSVAPGMLGFGLPVILRCVTLSLVEFESPVGCVPAARVGCPVALD